MSNVWERFEGIVTVGEVEKQQKSMIKLNAGLHKMIVTHVDAGEDDNGVPVITVKLKTVLQEKPITITQKLQGSDPSKTAWMIAKGVEIVSKISGEDITFTTLGSLANNITNLKYDGNQYEVQVAYKEYKGVEYANYTVIGKVQSQGEMNEFDTNAGDETDF